MGQARPLGRDPRPAPCTWVWGSEVDLERERQEIFSSEWEDPDDDYCDTDPPSSPEEPAAARIKISQHKLGRDPATPVEVLRALRFPRKSRHPLFASALGARWKDVEHVKSKDVHDRVQG